MRPFYFVWVLFALSCSAKAQDAEGPLGPPLVCGRADACFVQNYPDIDPSAEALDPSCGRLTYDGHDGVDVRVRAAAARAGVAVVAPVTGVVRGARDGEADGVYRAIGRTAVTGRECGNGVAIVGDDGLEVQLCHLRRGSVVVRAGQRVIAGQQLGLVGQSGMAAFPHVHVSVRREGVAIDPGSGRALTHRSCSQGSSGPSAGTLWNGHARRTLPFAARSAIADWGFLESAPENAQNADLAPVARGSRTASALVFYATFAGTLAEDVQRIRIIGPNGSELLAIEETQTRNQAQMVRYAGRRTPAGGWPAGAYRAEASFWRDGALISSQSETIILR